MHSSSTMAMSEPSASCTSTAFSGVSKCSAPSRCDRKSTPWSVIFRSPARLKTFKAVSQPDKCSSRVATLLQARCLLKLRQIAAQPTLSKTQTSQSPKTTPNADPALIFFGFAAENPIANRMRIQIQDSSRELPSATSHLGASLARKELTLVATMCSGSTSPGDFSASVIMANIEVMADGIVACVAIANEVEYFNPAPVNRLNDAQ